MADQLGFDEKIESLLAYGQALEGLPQPPREVWYQDWRDPGAISKAINKAVGDVLANHARMEYGPHGRNFADQDLRDDTPEQRLARSRILAVMTRPRSMEEIEAGAEAINDFFGKMLEGATIEIAPFGKGKYKAQTGAVDANLPIFGIFKGEVYHRTFRIQQSTTSEFVTPVLAVPLHHVVSGEGISFS